MLTVYEAQQNIRRTGQLWARGKYGSNVCILVTVLDDGSWVATAEDEHIALDQFSKALTRVYPDHSVRVRGLGGYWRADGEVRT